MALSSNFLSWVGEMKTNYWPGLEDKNYNFYNKVKYFKNLFEIGCGVTIPNKNKSVDIYRIHCLYEDSSGNSSSQRFRAIVERFYKPGDLPLNGHGQKFHPDYEIIQEANVKYRNVPIDSFRKKCVIIFAVTSEKPEEILKTYGKSTEPVYICRYIMVKNDDMIKFHSSVKAAMRNGYKISDNNETEDVAVQEKKEKQYRITSLECDNEIKLKLKRSSICSPDRNNKNETFVPTVLLEKLNLNDTGNKWTVRKPLSECETNTPTKREACNHTPSKSRRKQNFQHKMYSELNEDEIFVCKETDKQENKKDTVQKQNKTNTPLRSPKRKLVYDNVININSDDEKLEKENKNDTKKKKIIKTESDRLNEIEALTNKMKVKLGIVTPQKIHCDSPKSTPTRRRLVRLEEETDEEPNSKTPKKKDNDHQKNTKKSALRSSPRKLIIINSDEEVVVNMKTISTPKETDILSSDEDEAQNRSTKQDKSRSKTRGESPESKYTTRRSTRIRNTPRKILAENSDDEHDLKPRRSTRKSVVSTKQIVEESSNDEQTNKKIQHVTRNLRNTHKQIEDDNTRRSTRKSLRNTPRKILGESTDDNSPVKIKTEPVNKILKNVIEGTPSKSKKDSPTKKTPKKNSSRVNISCLTPEIEARTNVLTPSNNPFERARAQLNSTLRPGCLPCREKEFDDIMTFLSGKLKDNSGGCMYISGVPGTGKTATVCEIMKLLNNGKNKKKNDFKFISVNALSLTEPRQVYVEIVKQMIDKTKSWDESLTYIRNFFLKGKHPLHILLIDELDKLCTRKQDVIYNLLDLPSQSKTPLVVLTIANTMDLPERLLSNKVNSRLGLTRLTFHPYKHKELIDIVKTRLSQHGGVFRNEALEFIARKVAAVSGDARRALAICGRATEIAEASGIKEITMDIVNKTLVDMASSPKVQAIKSCSNTEKMILQAIVHEVTRTGNDEVSFPNIVQLIEGMCILDSVQIPSTTQLLSSCQRLNFFRLIIMQEGKHDVSNTLLLNVSSDDIHFALKDD